MYTLLLVFTLCLFVLMGTFLIGGIIYNATKGKHFARIYHDIFHWHLAKYDFGDNRSVCAVCGKFIVKTENGPWIATR